MRFEIPFNETIFREQLKLNFDLAWNNNLKKSKSGLFFGIVCLIFAVLLFLAKENTAFLLLGITAFYLLTFINYYSYYRKKKKNYFRLVDELVTGFVKEESVNIWEFNEDDFRYKDYRCEIKVKWLAFKGFMLKDDNLFIYLDDDKMLSYILGKSEVGNENFDKIIEFLNLKIKGQVPIFNRAKD